MLNKLIQNIGIIEELNIRKKSVFHYSPALDNSSFILKSGFVVEKANISISTECMIDIIGPGEILAGESIYHKTNREFHYFFATEGILYKFATSELMRLISTDIEFNQILNELISQKIIEHKKIHICKSMTDTEEKILSFLNIINRKLDNTIKTIPLTRSELACISGLRTETVIRTIKKLQKEGRVFLNQKGEIIRYE